MTSYPSHYINGRWVEAQSADKLPVHDSSTEEIMATVPSGTAAEAEQAVLAARAAFDAWSSLPAETRAAYLDKVAAGLKARVALPPEGFGDWNEAEAAGLLDPVLS